MLIDGEGNAVIDYIGSSISAEILKVMLLVKIVTAGLPVRRTVAANAARDWHYIGQIAHLRES